MSAPSAAPVAPASPIAAAESLAPTIRASADEGEHARRLPATLVAAFTEAGFFRLCVPRSLGGGEVDPATLVRTVETLAAADGAAAWCAMIGATSGLLAGYLPADVAREVYGDPAVVTGGVFAPLGTATVTAEGYRVRGRWPFASGCEHCQWLMGGCVVVEDGAPRLLERGLPDSRLALFPAGAARILDTWTVAGLRGTGSHDIAVDDLVVPPSHTVSLMTDQPRERGPLYAFPVFGLLALGIAAVGLGLARAAIDALVALAGAKTPSGSRRRLADRPLVQAEVARAEAALGGARTFLLATIAEAWEAAAESGTIVVALRGRLRLAATHATATAAKAVDAMYEAGGGSAVYATSPLQRCFRDVHAVTQHAMVAPATWELTGRLLLGLETDAAML